MLSPAEKERYHRHTILPELGLEGQAQLKQARVLVIGAGGLGHPVLQYLTAAGVGEIGIVDDDRVDVSNLQRQVLFSTADVGQLKAVVAKDKLQRQNPFVHFRIHSVRFTPINALNLISMYDVVVDGTDNFPTRYLVNDACVLANKPLVFGSIFKFEGQVSVFNYQGGPTYRCLYPQPPDSQTVPSCSEIGVLGVLPSIVGSWMATETIKIITGIGQPLRGKLLLLNALNNQHRELKFSKSDCQITELEKNYEAFCGILETPSSIDVFELKEWLINKKEIQIIDVRESFERAIAFIPSDHFPMNGIPNFLDQIRKDVPVVVYCHHGMRSQHVIHYLKAEIGLTNLINLTGGIHAWSVQIDPTVPVY